MIAERLRRSILQAAVQGKLTKQLPGDGDARELLNEIQKNKVRLIKEGKIKNEKTLPEITKDELPFDIPENWCWVRLGDVTNYGCSEKSDSGTISDKTWVLDLEDIEKTTSKLLVKVRFADRRSKSTKNVFKKGDVLYCKLRPYLDKVIVADEDGVCTTEILPVRAFYGIIPEYIRLVMKSPSFISYVNSLTYGMKMPRLGTEDGRSSLFPLAPIKEQRRLVDCLEEILPKIEKLQNDELNLDVLQRAFPKKMKDSILQYAVKGKLTEQLPSDDDAHDLLKEIKKEKAQLIKEGKIKKEKPLPEIMEDEAPFDIPENWCWVRLGEIITLRSGQDLTPDKYHSFLSGIPYVTGASNFFNGEIIIDRWTNTPQSIANKDELLITCKGTIGEMAFLREERAHIARQVMAIKVIEPLNRKFVNFFLQCYVTRLKSMAKSMIPGINREMILHSMMPLPPVEEQNRIVQRLEELLPKIDKLEQQIQTHMHALSN
jgi:type I restriction enzyme S subunit